MQLSFEQEKNIKAGVYTGLICLALSLVFFVLKWQEPAPKVVPPLPEYMEVNLGNSNTGSGDIPPMSQSAPAPEQGANATKTKVASSVASKINANSKDATVDIAKQYGCVVVPGGLPAKGRNSGARVAKGEILFFLDADTILPDHFLKRSLQGLAKRNLDIASFRLKPFWF